MMTADCDLIFVVIMTGLMSRTFNAARSANTKHGHVCSPISVP